MKEIHGGNIYKYSHRVYDFSANLNPLGMPQEVKDAITENLDRYESYPDPWNRELSAALSSYHGVEAGRICCGNGAADIIFRIALGLRPKKALVTAPTFSEYEEALKTCGSKVIYYDLKEEKDFRVDDGILSAIDDSLDMLFLCNPNNPTGIPVERELVLAISEKCRSCGVILVIDECFSEFLEEEERYSVMDDIESLENVIILKAFTKIYAMAGLRLGYCVCGSLAYAEIIRSTLQPWAVSTVSAKAGCAALLLTDFVEETKKYIKENREFLMAGLKALGYRVYPAKANYVFFRGDAGLAGELEKFDIVIRKCGNYRGLDERYYRIAVRTREENEYFLKYLGKITQGSEEQIHG